MTTTPLWVPLVVAALGVLGTIAGTVVGVVITQKRSDQREQTIWNREGEREREHRAREDSQRTFDQRRQAYVNFYESLQAMAREILDYWIGVKDHPFDWEPPAFCKLQQLRVYASPEVARAATKAYKVCAWWMWHVAEWPVDEVLNEQKEQYFSVEKALYHAIRRDLGIVDEPDGEIPSPLISSYEECCHGNMDHPYFARRGLLRAIYTSSLA